jgi:hypothetical protein
MPFALEFHFAILRPNHFDSLSANSVRRRPLRQFQLVLRMAESVLDSRARVWRRPAQ